MRRKAIVTLLLVVFSLLLTLLLSGPARAGWDNPGGRVDTNPQPVLGRPELAATTSLSLTGLSRGAVVSRYLLTNTSLLSAEVEQRYYDLDDHVVATVAESVPGGAVRQVDLQDLADLPLAYEGYVVISSTQPLTARLLPPRYRLQQVALAIPDVVTAGVSTLFTATATPLSTTLPLTFTWETDGAPPLIHTARGLVDTASFSWAEEGLHPLTVTVSQGWSRVETVHLVRVGRSWATEHLWLPLVFGPPPNRPPSPPAQPTPASGSSGVALSPLLRWSEADDPEGAAVTYDVYLEADVPVPSQHVCSGGADKVCAPGTLAADTVYSWRVVARDAQGAETSGPVWTFHTRGDDVTAAVVDLVNQERVAAGCSPLVIDSRLAAAAQGHSDDMAHNDFFSHTGSNGSTLVTRVLAQEYGYQLLGENIAAGYTSPEAVMEGWMNSPGHRENILNCAFSEIGVGYVYLAQDPGEVRYHHYWTQVFGRPR